MIKENEYLESSKGVLIAKVLFVNSYPVTLKKGTSIGRWCSLISVLCTENVKCNFWKVVVGDEEDNFSMSFVISFTAEFEEEEEAGIFNIETPLSVMWGLGNIDGREA